MDIKVAFFDMDGTLIKENSWDLIYKSIGLETSPYLKDYLEGKIPYRKLVELDIGYWKINGRDVKRSMIEQLAKKVSIKEDARIITNRLKKHGVKLVMVTAGLYEFADYVGRELGFDRIYANKFLYDKNGLIMDAIIEVEPLHKYKLIEKYLNENGLEANNAISVGDTLYDESMFRATAYGFLLDEKDNTKVNGKEYKIKSLVQLFQHINMD